MAEKIEIEEVECRDYLREIRVIVSWVVFVLVTVIVLNSTSKSSRSKDPLSPKNYTFPNISEGND
jgi:hypothetical protein